MSTPWEEEVTEWTFQSPSLRCVSRVGKETTDEFCPDLGPERDLRGTLVQLLYLPVDEMGAPERVVVCQRPGRTLAGPREDRCPRGKGNQTA